MVHFVLPGTNRRVRVQAARLVYEALIGPIPDGATIRFRNNDPNDTRPENLVAAPPGPVRGTRCRPRKKAPRGA